MALVGYALQQNSENKDYDIDYTDLVTPSGDTVTGVVATLSPVTDPVLQVTGVVADSKTAKIWVTGGKANTVYCVTVVTTTNDGRIAEDEFEIEIEEVC